MEDTVAVHSYIHNFIMAMK